MKVAIYIVETGEITGMVDCSPSMIELQVHQGEEFYLNPPPNATHIINGRPVTIVPEPVPPTAEELRTIAKAERTRAVASIVVTISTGKVFDGDELSQTRMARAIIGMQAINRETITWTLADNSIVEVTVAELIEALCLAGERQSELWPITI